MMLTEQEIREIKKSIAKLTYKQALVLFYKCRGYEHDQIIPLLSGDKPEHRWVTREAVQKHVSNIYNEFGYKDLPTKEEKFEKLLKNVFPTFSEYVENRDDLDRWHEIRAQLRDELDRKPPPITQPLPKPKPKPEAKPKEPEPEEKPEDITEPLPPIDKPPEQPPDDIEYTPPPDREGVPVRPPGDVVILPPPPDETGGTTGEGTLEEPRGFNWRASWLIGLFVIVAACICLFTQFQPMLGILQALQIEPPPNTPTTTLIPPATWTPFKTRTPRPPITPNPEFTMCVVDDESGAIKRADIVRHLKNEFIEATIYDFPEYSEKFFETDCDVVVADYEVNVAFIGPESILRYKTYFPHAVVIGYYGWGANDHEMRTAGMVDFARKGDIGDLIKKIYRHYFGRSP